MWDKRHLILLVVIKSNEGTKQGRETFEQDKIQVHTRLHQSFILIAQGIGRYCHFSKRNWDPEIKYIRYNFFEIISSSKIL